MATKRFALSDLSASDIEAISYALTVFTQLLEEEGEDLAEIAPQCCASAIAKITAHSSHLNSMESKFVKTSIETAQAINQGLIPVDAETASECRKRLFTFNKLAASLGSSS